jgi:hypothetical protein
MQFRLTIDCDNDAFAYDRQDYIAALLRDVADSVEAGGNISHPINIRDANGNRVGSFVLTEAEEG